MICSLTVCELLINLEVVGSSPVKTKSVDNYVVYYNICLIIKIMTTTQIKPQPTCQQSQPGLHACWSYVYFIITLTHNKQVINN